MVLIHSTQTRPRKARDRPAAEHSVWLCRIHGHHRPHLEPAASGGRLAPALLRILRGFLQPVHRPADGHR
jgi:hypothetical protein